MIGQEIGRQIAKNSKGGFVMRYLMCYFLIFNKTVLIILQLLQK